MAKEEGAENHAKREGARWGVVGQTEREGATKGQAEEAGRADTPPTARATQRTRNDWRMGPRLCRDCEQGFCKGVDVGKGQTQRETQERQGRTGRGSGGLAVGCSDLPPNVLWSANHSLAGGAGLLGRAVSISIYCCCATRSTDSTEKPEKRSGFGGLIGRTVDNGRHGHGKKRGTRGTERPQGRLVLSASVSRLSASGTRLFVRSLRAVLARAQTTHRMERTLAPSMHVATAVSPRLQGCAVSSPALSTTAATLLAHVRRRFGLIVPRTMCSVPQVRTAPLAQTSASCCSAGKARSTRSFRRRVMTTTSGAWFLPCEAGMVTAVAALAYAYAVVRSCCRGTPEGAQEPAATSHAPSCTSVSCCTPRKQDAPCIEPIEPANQRAAQSIESVESCRHRQRSISRACSGEIVHTPGVQIRN